MAKVSIGLRGWRFEESEVFDDAGEFKPLDDIPEDPRRRLIRLTYLVEQPCDACYLVHGESEIQRCRQARIVYGEPMEEVLLCDQHEADFIYWYQHEGGTERRGTETFRDEFHEWFADGGRAPEGFGGLEHVETDPKNLPDPPDANELHRRLNENFEGDRVEFRPHEEPEDEDELDLDDVDFGTDYPKR
ncbi:MAG: hypothetical protein ACQETI_03675 [Halobacteriota archaeon]